MGMKKSKIRWKRVIIAMILPIILIGGIFMVSKNFFLTDETADKVTEKKEENNLDTTTQDSGEDTNEEESDVDDTTANLEKAPSNYLEYTNMKDGNYLTEKGYTLTIKDGVAYVDGNLIVNKTYAVPSDYKPVNTSSAVTSERCINCLEMSVMEAFNLMKSDALAVNLNIYIASGYRSYNYQNTLYNNYSAVSGVDGADTYSARPGHSEHQTGLCFDLNSVDDSFANTAEGKWIDQNAYRYGFIVRYPKGKENITGYQYESWHLRYVGEELASKLYNNGDWLTMEEYYGISSSYK